MSGQKSSRRDFIRLAAATTVSAGMAPVIFGTSKAQTLKPPVRKISANDRVRLGTIGTGIIGFIDTDTALRVPGIEFVGAADVYDSRLRRVRERYGQDKFITRDYRELIARPDIDAVIIATPDHWHAQMAVDAMEAGKAVYLEKPMVQDLEEGPRVIEAQRRTGKPLQVGSQNASSLVFTKVREFFRDGAIGKLNLVESRTTRNSAGGAWQYSLPASVTEKDLDWESFLGNAPKRPFEPIRYFRWRNYRDYGTGVAGDLFIHLFTGIHYALDSIGPTEIMGQGGLRYWKDGRDVEDVVLGLFDYPETASHPAFSLALQVNLADGGGGENSFKFIGDEGVITVGYNGVTLNRSPRYVESERDLVEGYNSVSTWAKEERDAFVEAYRRENPTPPTRGEPVTQEYETPNFYDARYDHFVNFFESVRTGKPTNEDPIFGYRAAAPSLMSNLSMWEKKIYHWDPEAMKVVNGTT